MLPLALFYLSYSRYYTKLLFLVLSRVHVALREDYSHSSICHIRLLCILPFRNNNSLTRLITIMAPAITTAQVSNNGVGLGGMGRYRYRPSDKRLHNLFSLVSLHLSSLLLCAASLHFYPRPPALCFLCLSLRPPHPAAPPPPSPPPPPPPSLSFWLI